MPDASIPEYRISIEQLKPGVFIRLEGFNWFQHPFLFSSFKIVSDEQIAILRKLGIKDVLCVPSKSDTLPGKPAPESSLETPEEKPQAAEEVVDQLWEAKRERAQRLQEKKARIGKTEEEYKHSLEQVSKLMQNISSGGTAGVRDAMDFVEELSEKFLSDMESSIHLMNVLQQADSIYYHSLNVTVLALMLGREAGLIQREMVILGMGAMFHDIGKSRIPKKLLRKRTPLSKPEQELMRMHSQYGREMLEPIEAFPHDATRIVYEHHENFDGSGYPQGMSGDQISRLARLIAIVNAYDNLCNPMDSQAAVSPYQALSIMFGQQKNLYDYQLLALFIRCLGVYPPGTVVRLSNGSIGMVVSVNKENQLAPSVLIYDPHIPKKEALVIDLTEEPDIRVEQSIRPSNLPDVIYDYLSLRPRISYFVGGGKDDE